jgi:multiple sugar transport system permease protein
MNGRTHTLYWTAIALASAALLALLWVAPLLWAVSTALRPEHETISPVLHLLPREWTVAAFAKVLGAGNVTRWLFNSALVSLLVTGITMFVSLLAAFAFSQLRFRGRDVLFALAMLALLLPFEALLVPLFRTMNGLGLINSYAGIVLPQVVSPVAIYVFRQFFDQVPADFREAAVLMARRRCGCCGASTCRCPAISSGRWRSSPSSAPGTTSCGRSSSSRRTT